MTNPRKNIFIKDLEFSKERVAGKIMQSHTNHIINEYLYFTYNIEGESRLYKVSLKDYTISDSLTLPQKYCVMGTLQKSINITKDTSM